MTFPTIVSYYTEKTGYEEEIKNLIASCEKFSLPYHIDSLPSMGSWEKNCCYKPRYLLEKLNQFKAPILWLDADAVLVKPPHLFKTLEADIALRVVNALPNSSPSKMISGTLFFNNTPKAKEILKAWDNECQRLLKENSTEVWDQVCLRNVLLNLDANVYPLNRSYYTIYDTIKTQADQDEAIIIHYQASRLFKKEINQLVVPFWTQKESAQGARALFAKSPTALEGRGENEKGGDQR